MKELIDGMRAGAGDFGRGMRWRRGMLVRACVVNEDDIRRVKLA